MGWEWGGGGRIMQLSVDSHRISTFFFFVCVCVCGGGGGGGVHRGLYVVTDLVQHWFR